MKTHIYIINKDIQGFKEGQIVQKTLYPLKSKTKTHVTNYEIIGKWPCCRCNRYRVETIQNKHLTYLDEIQL